MGNPLSPTIGDLVMETLVDTVMTRTTFPVPVLKKYVEDILLAVPRDKIAEVLQIFIQHQARFQFTVEVEVETE